MSDSMMVDIATGGGLGMVVNIVVSFYWSRIDTTIFNSKNEEASSKRAFSLIVAIAVGVVFSLPQLLLGVGGGNLVLSNIMLAIVGSQTTYNYAVKPLKAQFKK